MDRKSGEMHRSTIASLKSLEPTKTMSKQVNMVRISKIRPDDSTSISNRNSNLDLLRATAICLVIVHHGIQASPLPSSWIKEVANFGRYGVDLFFVLSGWLIGGLYWRELRTFGNVAIRLFWVRRWLRTIPPYAAALLISWGAVYVTRQEPFDFGYLFFFQNYYEQIPFFLVSWSLCVEEHFYLMMPIVMFLLGCLFYGKGIIGTLLILLALAPVMRWFSYAEATNQFGYFVTATHLHMSGLILGALLSYLATAMPRTFFFVARFSVIILIVTATAAVLLHLGGKALDYALSETLIALFFAAILAWFVRKPQIGDQATAIFYPIAVCSYSVYLTHPIALHIANRAQLLFPGREVVCYFLAAGALTFSISVIFYFAFERTSIRIRDYFWSRRV
jgi:peptidoglycan/LPS O-acetylase OafA/YrhL